MNKAELVKEMRARIGEGEISMRTAEKALDAFQDIVMETVSTGEQVRLIGFGTFKAVRMAARNGFNPATKERIEIPSKVAPKFTPGSLFKDYAETAPVRD